MKYIKPEVFNPDKIIRVLNWTSKDWSHTYNAETSYLDKIGNSMVGNKTVTLNLAAGEEKSFPEGVAHYLATRLAEWSYGTTGKNIATAPDRGERILRALPDLTPKAEEEVSSEGGDGAEAIPEKAPKAKKEKAEDEFAGAKPKTKKAKEEK